jgi:hypothetical protein
VFSPSSRGRLTARDLERFPDETLFHRLARAVCLAGCLPRKELYETWEMARRVRRRFRGGRIVDLGGGHGLLAQVMLLLDDSSPDAVVVDKSVPRSAATLHGRLAQTWPRLSGRITFAGASLDEVEILPTDVVVSSHACGALTDRVLERAASARARVAVLPCCHHLSAPGRNINNTTGADDRDADALSAWVDGALAMDIGRAMHLRQQRYRIWTLSIPADITPKNRLLLGAPLERTG